MIGLADPAFLASTRQDDTWPDLANLLFWLDADDIDGVNNASLINGESAHDATMRAAVIAKSQALDLVTYPAA